MKYFVRIDEREFEVEIVGRADEPLSVVVDGETLHADLTRVGASGPYSLLLDGESYELLAEAVNDRCEVIMGGEVYDVEVQDERTRLLASLAPKGPVHEGEVPIKAPMPGLVKDVAVRPGDAVKTGQRLLILEAMKMENELRSPIEGTVKSVAVNQGEAVEQGRLLIVLE